MINGHVYRYPVQPGVKRTVASKRWQRAVRLDERLLGHVFHFRGIPDETGQQSAELALVLRYEQIKRLFVARLRTLDQSLVYIPVIHSPPLPCASRLCCRGALLVRRQEYTGLPSAIWPRPCSKRQVPQV